MSQEQLLRREANEMRALLDLSYARERALAGALLRARQMLEGAAVAPANETKIKGVLTLCDEVLATLSKPAAPPEGLFIRHAKLVCELAGAAKAVELLRTELTSESRKLSELTETNRDLEVGMSALEAEKAALLQLINDPPVTERVMEAARQLMPSP